MHLHVAEHPGNKDEELNHEKLMYNSVKLTAIKCGAAISTATGFFVDFVLTDQETVPVLVTNKHVVANADAILATCHLADGNKPLGKFATCEMPIKLGLYFPHPDPSVDLCAIPIASIMNQGISAGTPLYLSSVGLDVVPTDDQWEHFDAIEDITMTGCPNGISDEVNNFPIARRGITASSLAKRYNGKEEFLVDMACFPGSSGSPIFVYDRNGYFDRQQSVYVMGQQRIILVGILYAGPQVTNTGHVVLERTPSVAVAAMMHLGNAIRSSALYALQDQITALISKGKTAESE